MKSDVSSALREKVRKCVDDVIRWRHQIHEYPELSFQEAPQVLSITLRPPAAGVKKSQRDRKSVV